MSEQEQGKSPETMDQKPSPKKKKRCFLASILPWKGDKFGEGLRKIILLAAIITLLVSGGKLLYETVYLPAQSDNAMNSIQQLYRPDGDSGDSQDDGSDTEANTEPARDDQGRLEKFLPLLEVNSDIKGWITVPNSKIDYPVLQSEKDLLLQPGENETYLYTDYQGNNTKYGSIFIDAHCDVGRLLVQCNFNLAGFSVKALCGIVIANFTDCIANDCFNVNRCIGCNFTHN